MKIKDLKIGAKGIDIVAEIIEKGEVIEFDRFGRKNRVVTTTLKDNSGTITMPLWNEEIDNIEVGNKIKITNGYVREFQGKLQILAGRYGKLTVC